MAFLTLGVTPFVQAPLLGGGAYTAFFPPIRFTLDTPGRLRA